MPIRRPRVPVMGPLCIRSRVFFTTTWPLPGLAGFSGLVFSQGKKKKILRILRILRSLRKGVRDGWIRRVAGAKRAVLAFAQFLRFARFTQFAQRCPRRGWIRTLTANLAHFARSAQFARVCAIYAVCANLRIRE